MEYKNYELYFIASPPGTQMQEDLFDFIDKYGKSIPPIFVMGIELQENETVKDLENKMRDMLRAGGGKFSDELQAE
jgi:hypothetical protein